MHTLLQEYMKHMVEFMSEKPQACLQSISNGIGNTMVRISIGVYHIMPDSFL